MSMFYRKCPCCGYKFSILNYHLYTRVLPEDNPTYKSLHCLKCNHKIQKEESIYYNYIKTIITFILSILFSIMIRSFFDIWNHIYAFAVNIPFMILFYILKYIYDYYFNSTNCYNERTKVFNNLDKYGGNINGIFGKKEKQVYKNSKYLIFWIFTCVLILILVGAIK